MTRCLQVQRVFETVLSKDFNSGCAHLCRTVQGRDDGGRYFRNIVVGLSRSCGALRRKWTKIGTLDFILCEPQLKFPIIFNHIFLLVYILLGVSPLLNWRLWTAATTSAEESEREKIAWLRETGGRAPTRIRAIESNRSSFIHNLLFGLLKHWPCWRTRKRSDSNSELQGRDNTLAAEKWPSRKRRKNTKWQKMNAKQYKEGK